MTSSKSAEPKGSVLTAHRKGGRPRKLAPSKQIIALGNTKSRRGKSPLIYLDCIGLVRAIVKATGHKRAALLREFAEQKKMSDRHARRLLPAMQATVHQTNQINRVTTRFVNSALAQFAALETSFAHVEYLTRTTAQTFDSFIARVTRAHKKIENKHRELIFHHPRVWNAATQVTTDPASLEIILNAWRDAPDDDARELVIKELEEIARAK